MLRVSHNKGQYMALLPSVICKRTVAYAPQCKFLLAVFSNNSWSASAVILCQQSVPRIWYWTVLTAKLHSKFLSHTLPNHSWTRVNSWHTRSGCEHHNLRTAAQTSAFLKLPPNCFIWVSFILPLHFLHDTNDFKEYPHGPFSHFFTKLLTVSQKFLPTLDHLWHPSVQLSNFHYILSQERGATWICSGIIVFSISFANSFLIIPNLSCPLLATYWHRA